MQHLAIKRKSRKSATRSQAKTAADLRRQAARLIKQADRLSRSASKKSKSSTASAKRATREAERAARAARKRINETAGQRSAKDLLRALREFRASFATPKLKRSKPATHPKKRRAKTPRSKTRQIPVPSRVRVGSAEIREYQFPIPYKNLRQFLNKLKRDKTLNGALPPGGHWAFEFKTPHGDYRSHEIFSTVAEMVDYLNTYLVIVIGVETGDEEKQRAIYDMVSYVIVGPDARWAKLVNTRHAAWRAPKRRRPVMGRSMEAKRRRDRIAAKAKRDRMKAQGGPDYGQYLLDRRERYRRKPS
jgi:hypothetical protein